MGDKSIIELRTERMRLVPGNIDTFKAELAGPEKLSPVLGVDVPEGWPSPEVREMLTGMIDNVEKDPEYRIRLISWYWVVEDDLTGKPILAGNGGFYRDHDSGELLLGYGMLERFHGNGYGTEAVKAIIQWAFSSSGIERIFAETSSDNRASVRVLEKCGFTLTGMGIDEGSIRYTLTKNAWQA